MNKQIWIWINDEQCCLELAQGHDFLGQVARGAWQAERPRWPVLAGPTHHQNWSEVARGYGTRRCALGRCHHAWCTGHGMIAGGGAVNEA
jgi:hypothetical protein